MTIIHTHHAQFRMETRRISKDMVYKALTSPDQVGTGYRNRKIAYKNFASGTIKVVYNVENDDFIVISAMWQE